MFLKQERSEMEDFERKKTLVGKEKFVENFNVNDNIN